MPNTGGARASARPAKKASAPPAKKAAASTSTSTTSRTGLQLDPNDQGARPVDDSQDQEPEESGPGAAERAKNAAGAAGEFLSRGSWAPTLKPPTRARDAGGLAFGLLLYTAVITYIRYGAEGWTGWLSAKFLNKPLQGVPGKGGPKKDVKV